MLQMCVAYLHAVTKSNTCRPVLVELYKVMYTTNDCQLLHLADDYC